MDIDLVGTGEIRQMLGGLSKQRVHVITRRRDFPAPIAELIQGPVWRRSDVEAWIRENRPNQRGE